jgi:hypothetical protein
VPGDRLRSDGTVPYGPHMRQETDARADGVHGCEPLEMIKEEIARGDAVLLRTDTKAGLLLAVFGPITAVGVVLLTKVSLHPAVTVLLAATAGLLGTAVLQLLWTIRPHLPGSELLIYATMTHEQVAEHFAEHFAQLAGAPERWHCERLVVLSRLSLRKFRLVRLACMLIALAVFLLVFTALVALVFRP